MLSLPWKLPFGASVEPDGIRFRLWAPDANQVAIVIDPDGRSEVHAMQRGTGGYYHAFVAAIGAGARYKYLVDGTAIPDPAARSLPDGVHGASEALDPHAFAWSDAEWRGLDADRLIIYELHIGTFTLKGTFDAAIQRLDELVTLGVTAVEVMPIASFAGARNWGYDGVAWFAPTAAYGGAHGFRRFVDAAHRRGLGVILDVVYNHLGPDGNYLALTTGNRIFNRRHQTAWGDAVNFDGPDSESVRDFVLQNALHWALEYHVDGLRLDATHAMVDDSSKHILQEIGDALHRLEPRRLVIAEDDRNERRLVLPAQHGGFGLDAVWADDLHHQLRRMAAGDSDAYFRSYAGTVRDVVATLRRGWFFEGQWSEHHGAPRGTPADDIPPRAFVHCIQNHDQVGNRALGDRLHDAISPSLYRALSALLLLSPYTPLIWMGQEWGATSPFQFFTDFTGDLGELVRAGRRREFAASASFDESSGEGPVPDPQDESTFLRSRLCWSERDHWPHCATLALYTDLLALRATLAAGRRHVDDFVVEELSDSALAMQRRKTDGSVVLVISQLEDDTLRLSRDHPLLSSKSWSVVLRTEAERFGGSGASSDFVVQGPETLVLSSS